MIETLDGNQTAEKDKGKITFRLETRHEDWKRPRLVIQLLRPFR